VLDRKRRFVWLLTLLLSAGFVSTSLISYWVAHESISDQISQNTLPLTSDNVYSEIQRDLLHPIFISSLMAQDTFVRDWVIAGESEPAKLIRYLKEIQDRYHTVTSFFVSDVSRNYYHSTAILKKVDENSVEDRWYFRSRDLPEGVDYEINIDSDTADRKSTTVFVNYRVYDYAGAVIGVIGVGLAVDVVKELIESYQQRFQRRVFFIDHSGEITMYGNQFKGEHSIHRRPGLATIAQQILNTPDGAFSYRHEGKTVYLNSRLIPEFQWQLIVEQEADPAEQRLFNTLLVNLFLSLMVTAIVFFFVNMMVERYQRRLETMATTDKLTGVANREMFELLLEQSIKDSIRRGSAIAVIMLDIDHFKRVNDQYGHLVGDRVLHDIAATIATKIRSSDTLCRWGGEEFTVLLPDCDLTQANKIAEQIRVAIESHHIAFGSVNLAITASFGVSQYRAIELSEELFRRVDKALYQAKEQGRNQVVSRAL
jgi:diguanylate cyclase (GGDEF)-like protein